MKLPSMRYADRIGKSQQIKFGGLNHTAGAQDGELWDMKNLTSDHYPLLATRPPRWHYKHRASGGIFAWDKLCWVDGKKFYYDGVACGQVSSGEKVFGCLAPYIVILPDKMYYNVDTGEFGAIEATWTGKKLIFEDGTIGGVAATANTIRCAGVDWASLFRPGDAVTIEGCTAYTSNNRTSIIREINGDKLIFSENCFTLAESGDTVETAQSGKVLSISRTMPDLKYICENENRLWGCTDTEIYACKLGDVFNWNVYDGLDTDSYTVDTGSAGVLTGCISYGGFPLFFKENHIYKVYGSYPSNFEVLGSATLGLATGSHRSLAIAGEILFYLSNSGVCAYTGGVPQPIGTAFGQERFHNAVGGSDGLKYYVSMDAGDDDWRLYVYDTQQGRWHKEDETQVTHFAQLGGKLYYLDATGNIKITGTITTAPDDASEEESVEWMAEFGDFTDEDPNRKGLSKLQLRLEMEGGAWVHVLLQFDSDGTWQEVAKIEAEDRKRSYYLPIIPRRTDHYRLKMEGMGGCKVHSLVRESYSGSELRAKRGRN